MKDFNITFLNDSKKFLKIFNSILIKIENGDKNIENIHEAFRCMHSIKSEASYIGNNDVTKTAHLAENLLDKIRKDNLSITADYIDKLHKISDKILWLVDNVEKAVGKNKIKTKIKTRKRGLDNSLQFQFSDFENMLFKEARLRNEKFYRLVCVFDDELQMKKTKAFLILNNLYIALEQRIF